MAGGVELMNFLERESIFISLLFLCFALWTTVHQPSIFSSFLVLVAVCITFWLVLRMAVNRL